MNSASLSRRLVLATLLVAGAAYSALTEIVAGETRPAKNSFPVPWVAAYDLKGAQQWSTRFEDYELASVIAIAVSADGQDIYVTGTYWPFSTDPSIFVARLDAEGSVLWDTTYQNGEVTWALALALDPRKEAIVCVGGEGGQLIEPPYQEALLVCFDTADGSVALEDLSGNAAGWDRIAGIAFAANGKKIYVVGYEDTEAGSESRRWFFQQFKARNGRARKRSHGTFLGNGAEAATGLAATKGGFYMIGEGCQSFQGVCDAYLVMLDGRGRPQGDMATFSPGGTSYATPEAIAVGPDGNPIWGGQVDSHSGPMWLQKIMR